MRILHFSGGLDSLATLFMLRKTWDTLTVLWVNTGAAYADTIELMAKVKKLPLQGFMEVNSDQPAWIASHGLPVDVLPVWDTWIGKASTGLNGQMYQSPFSCCGANIWAPAMQASVKLGAKVIYRGQRDSDKRRSPIKSGHEEGGITFIFPIEAWTRSQVRAYVEQECPDLVPAYYKTEDSSHDCMDCTAYLDENRQRIINLPPEIRHVVQRRLQKLQQSMREDITHIMEVANAGNV